MQERQVEVDLQGEFLQKAYANFKELAQKYGTLPSEGMAIPTNGRVFNLDIPSETNLHNHPDFVGGRYYGPDAGTIQIFYRYKDVATQIILSRNSHGKVSIDQSVLFELMHTKTGYTLHRHHGENLEPDINSLNELLDKAQQIAGKQVEPEVSDNNLSTRQKEIRVKEARVVVQKRKEETRLKNERNAKNKNGRK